MIPSQLPKAKFLARGEKLRTILADAISEAEVDASRRGADSIAAAQLSTMLAAGVTALAGIVDDAVPTAVSRLQAFDVPTIVLTYSKALDPDYVPTVASVVISSPTRTVTAVRVVGATVEVDYSGATLLTADSPLIAYTQPAASFRLRDQAGNLAASFVAAAVTVAAA